MRALGLLRAFFLVQVFVASASVSVTYAQQSGPNHPSPSENRRMVNDDTFRELMRVERETIHTSAATSDAGRAAQLKQLREDFKTLQSLNNRMMAEAWSREQLDYSHIADMISEINGRAARLKSNLALPEPGSAKKINERLSISGLKEFRSALSLMDRSIMSFVTNPIFQRPNLVEIDLAKQARLDLESVISLSGDLKKITANLKNAAISNH
jgi:hypothetical protein